MVVAIGLVGGDHLAADALARHKAHPCPMLPFPASQLEDHLSCVKVIHEYRCTFSGEQFEQLLQDNLDDLRTALRDAHGGGHLGQQLQLLGAAAAFVLCALAVKDGSYPLAHDSQSPYIVRRPLRPARVGAQAEAAINQSSLSIERHLQRGLHSLALVKLALSS